ncbi:MAG: hypothetical protein WBQ17_02615 [Rhizomicrobium sp.]
MAFLISEVLLFAGLFAGYSVYRGIYPQGFMLADRETDIVYGTINTAILMTSSLTIAVAAILEGGFADLQKRVGKLRMAFFRQARFFPRRNRIFGNCAQGRSWITSKGRDSLGQHFHTHCEIGRTKDVR